MVEPIKAICRVTLTIEVTPTDTWGADCQIAQANDQGRRSAVAMIQKIADESDGRIVIRSVDRADVVTFRDEKRV